MKPHGLDLILKEEILDNGEVVNSFENKTSFEAWMVLQNLKTGKSVELPMRSFVNNFIIRLNHMFAGTDGTLAKYLSVSAPSGSLASRYGLLIGETGSQTGSQITLSDTEMEGKYVNASLIYANTTFVNPTQSISPPIVITSEVRRLFQNNSATTFYVNEVGLKGRVQNAASSAPAEEGNYLLSRDYIFEGQIGDRTPGSSPIPFIADSDLRIDFKFKITHPADGSGGLMLNFMKLVFNTMFKGNINNSTTKITPRAGAATYMHASTSASAGASAAFYLGGSTAAIHRGIVIGARLDAPQNGDYLSGNEVNIDFMTDEFGCSANTISAVSSGSNTSLFTISRTFTNNTTNNKVIGRVGLLARGNQTDGAVLSNSQFIVGLNKPTTGTVVIQPSQVYRVTYTFQIQV